MAFETLYVSSTVNDQPITILIDGVSTYNFIQDKVVHSINLKGQPTTPLSALVSNGHQFLCNSVSKGDLIHIQF